MMKNLLFCLSSFLFLISCSTNQINDNSTTVKSKQERTIKTDKLEFSIDSISSFFYDSLFNLNFKNDSLKSKNDHNLFWSNVMWEKYNYIDIQTIHDTSIVLRNENSNLIILNNGDSLLLKDQDYDISGEGEKYECILIGKLKRKPVLVFKQLAYDGFIEYRFVNLNSGDEHNFSSGFPLLNESQDYLLWSYNCSFWKITDTSFIYLNGYPKKRFMPKQKDFGFWFDNKNLYMKYYEVNNEKTKNWIYQRIRIN